ADQVRNPYLLRADPASEHQGDTGTFLDARPRLDCFAIQLLVEHRVARKIRLEHRILDLQPVLVQHCHCIPETHADDVGHFDIGRLRSVDCQVNGSVDLYQVTRVRELFDDLHRLHAVHVDG